MSYVKNGKYYKGAVHLSTMVKPQQTMYKQHDHARQRFDHSAEILQPYKGNKPNKDFIEVYPDESVSYGFLPGEIIDPNAGRTPDYYDQ
jgi:hypothetical protein